MSLPGNSEVTQFIATGIGVKHEYLFVCCEDEGYISTCGSYRLINISNGVDCVMPEFTPAYPVFSHQRELHAIFSCQAGSSINAETELSQVVQIERFDISKWKWKFVGVVCELNKQDQEIVVKEGIEGITYILVVLPVQIMLFTLNHLNKIQQLPSRDIPATSHKRNIQCLVCETTGDLYFLDNDSLSLYIYSKQLAAWHMNFETVSINLPCKGKIHDSAASTFECKLFVKCFGHGGKPFHFYSYDLKSKTYMRLPAVQKKRT